MKGYLLVMAALALPVTAVPAAQPSPPPKTAMLSIADPAAFVGRLRRLGYTVGPFLKDSDQPVAMMKGRANDTALAFGGCRNGKGCTFLLLMAPFTDIQNPPAEWLNRTNARFDLVKVWKQSSGTTMVSHAVTFGDGLSPTTFQQLWDQWQQSVERVALSAVEEKLVK